MYHLPPQKLLNSKFRFCPELLRSCIIPLGGCSYQSGLSNMHHRIFSALLCVCSGIPSSSCPFLTIFRYVCLSVWPGVMDSPICHSLHSIVGCTEQIFLDITCTWLNRDYFFSCLHTYRTWLPIQSPNSSTASTRLPLAD